MDAAQTEAPAVVWTAHVPPMARLRLADVLKRLDISFTQAGAAVSMGRSTVYYIACTNRWPVRRDRWLLQERFKVFLQLQGATAVELDTLFCSQLGAPNPMRRGSVSKRSPKIAKTSQPKPDNKPSEVDVLLPKQTLTPQAGRHFKLFRNPFDGPVERPEQFFANDDTRYLREVMWQCAQNSGFVAVVGESGAGKTTLLADLEERLLREARGITLIKPSVLGMEERESAGHRMHAADILHAVVACLAPTKPMPHGIQARTSRAQALLTASAQAGNSHLLVIEEAHAMPDTTLRHLKRLHEMRCGRKSVLGILLLAQPELKKRLDDGLRAGSLREVAQRCEMVELPPLDADVAGYMTCRAAALGRKLETIVLPDAVEPLRAKLTKRAPGGALSLLYPLSVNNAVTRAMNIAAELGAPLVTADVMKLI